MRKDNPRRDLISRKPYPKDSLLRLIYANGELLPSNEGGRGYYLLRDKDLIASKAGKKALSRLLHHEPSEVELEKVLSYVQ